MNDFTKELQLIFSRTGDSELKNYFYESGKITLDVILFDDDILRMVFETEIIYCKKIEQRLPFNSGYFECIKLSDVLKTENNHYIFSGDFSDIMKAQKTKMNLVFGLNIQKYTHLITFSNNSIILAFIVNDKDSFSINIT